MESCYFPLLADNTSLSGWMASWELWLVGFGCIKNDIYSIGQSDCDSYVQPFVCVSMSERIFIKIFWSNILLCCALWEEQTPLFCVTFGLKGNKKERSFREVEFCQGYTNRSDSSSLVYLVKGWWLGLVVIGEESSGVSGKTQGRCRVCLLGKLWRPCFPWHSFPTWWSCDPC